MLLLMKINGSHPLTNFSILFRLLTLEYGLNSAFWCFFDRVDTKKKKIIVFLKFASALITPALSGGRIFFEGR